MNSYTDIVTAIQIELSTICNSLCIGCVRTDNNLSTTKNFIPNNEKLPLEKVIQVFTTNFGKKINKVEFCGTIDEPLAYPEFFPLIEKLFEERPDLKITIDTNGSIRDEKYHLELSKLLSKFRRPGIIKYSIDGIGSTHELYRYKTSYEKSLANMKAAVSGGADVFWQYVVFPWNETQKEKAQALASEIGVIDIQFRVDRSGASEMTPQQIRQLRAENETPKKRPIGKFELDDFVPRPKSKKISCRFIEKSEAMIFLAWDGRVWPCCFFANVYYAKESSQRAFEKYILNEYPENFNSIYEHSLDQILSHNLFTNDLMTSWSDANSAFSWRCNEKCSQDSCHG